MRQAAHLEELQEELKKARIAETTAIEAATYRYNQSSKTATVPVFQALEQERKMHALGTPSFRSEKRKMLFKIVLRQEKAEFTEKVEQMSNLQAALQRENHLLLEELISVLGRTKVLNAEMAWIHRSLPEGRPQERNGSTAGSPAVKLPQGSLNNSKVLSLQPTLVSPQHGLLSPQPRTAWAQGEAQASLIHPMRRACEARRLGPSDYHVVPAYGITDITAKMVGHKKRRFAFSRIFKRCNFWLQIVVATLNGRPIGVQPFGCRFGSKLTQLP
eukprot:symbB.v1.2.010897.t1/scaffold720.1/size169259/8